MNPGNMKPLNTKWKKKSSFRIRSGKYVNGRVDGTTMQFTKAYDVLWMYAHYLLANILKKYFTRMLTGWNTKWQLFLLCSALILILLLSKAGTNICEGTIRHLVIISATHFRHDDHGVEVFRLIQSPFEPIRNRQYDKIVLLFVTSSRFRKQYGHMWCNSFNGTDELRSVALPTVTTPPLPFCKWALFIAVCNVVREPSQLMLATDQRSKNWAFVPYRKPVRKHYDVVACFSPLFLNEHWQLLLTGLELRRAHGLSLQVLYIHSMRALLMDILKVYERQGFIALEKWSEIDLGDGNGLDYDPNYELVWRNQEGAHTDCFLKYKVSTKYIIVSDVDDILLPRIAPTYIKEFQFLLSNQNPSAMIYERQDVDVFTSSHPRNFSLYSLLRNAVVTNRVVTGKQVALTDNVITVNLHWPGLNNLNGHLKISFGINFMYHFRNWFYDVEPRKYVDPGASLSSEENDLLPLHSLIGERQLLKYQRNFELLMNTTFRDSFYKLHNKQLYYPLIDACYNEIFYKAFHSHKPIHVCPGPIRCQIPRIPGVRCISSRIHYEHFNLTPKLQLHCATHAVFIESSDGCRM